MPIDYSTLTTEQMQKMSPEEFDQIDPSLLPKSTGSSEITSELLTPSHSNEVIDNTDPTPTPENVDPEPTPTTPEVVPDIPPLDPTTPAVPSVEVPTPNGSDERSEITTEQGSGTSTEATAKEDTPNTNTTEADFYAKVTAKFNASGKEFQVTDANDVVALMQKGIDYNIKMANIKPALKMVKALEAHGITQEDLGLLIDIHQRKPEAIARLVKDSDIDLYSVDEDTVAQYAPTNAQISDVDYEFQSTVDSLSTSPRYADVISFVANASEADKKYVYENPGLLRTLVQHAEAGMFDQIVNTVYQQQMLGKLPVGMSPLQAYNAYGAQLFSNQPTNHVEPQQPVVQPVQSAPQPVQVPKAVPPVASAARQAAAAPSTAKTGATAHTYTPEELWKLSPEEFNKIDPKFL